MALNPVLDVPLPPYPELPPWKLGLKRGLFKHLRRATALGATVGALWLGGCYGATPQYRVLDEDADVVVTESDPDAGRDVIDGTDAFDATPDALPDAQVDAELDAEVLPDLTPCEPEARMGGMMQPVDYFVCTWDDPAPPMDMLPVFLGMGQSCEGGHSQAWFSLDERTRLRIGLIDWSENVQLTVMDSEARVLTQIGPGQACVELDVDVAVGLSAATATPTDDDSQYFDFYVDFVGDEEP